MTGRSELLIRQRIAMLRRALAGVRTGNAEAIHRARVATRRIREALPIVAAAPTARKIGRRVRRLTRAMGPVRELDVALQMLREFDTAGEVPAAAHTYLEAALRGERQRLLGELIPAVEPAAIDKLAKKSIEGARVSDAAPRPGSAVSPLNRRTVKRAERLRSAMGSVGAIYLPDRLHQVRIAVKKLRYALEIRTVVGPRGRVGRRQPARPTAHLRTLKRAQDVLGRMHDLEVLIARTRAVQGSDGAPDLHVSAELDSFVRRLEMECRMLHGQYMALRLPLLDICAEAAARARGRAPAA